MFKTKFSPASLLRKYSHLGIDSVILAIIAGLIVIGDVAVVLRFQNSPSVVRNFAVFDPVLTWLTAILAMAGVGLGLAAVVRKEKRRVVSWIGLIFNGLYFLGILSLYLIDAFTLMKVARG